MKHLRRIGRLLADLGVPLIAIGVCVVAYRFGVMAVAERIVAPSEPVLTALRRLGSVASVLVGYWIAARFYERRRPTELKLAPLPTLASAALGIALIGATLLALYALGLYRLVSVRGMSGAMPIVSMIFLVVVVEETVFRGVLFRLLEKHVGTAWALAVQPLAFGLLHLSNQGATAMTVVSVTLLGAFWSLLYVEARNLWVVIANHVAWNLTIFCSGLPLSGSEDWRLSAPLESTYEGPVWLTGGAFGPEDSLLNVLALTGVVWWLGARISRKGAFLSRSG
jgi:membrane protease YdiL (CAAX protease family)